MKKVFALAYDFLPWSSPGATVRTRKLIRYLPEFGWEATVICRDEPAPPARLRDELQPCGRAVSVPTPIPPRLSYQLGAWAWARRVMPRARALVLESRPDLIYASCPPFPHCLSAVRLAREARLPVVLDFRDSWSLDPYASGGALKHAAKWALCRWVYAPLERKAVAAAAAIIVTTPSMLREYMGIFAHARSRIHLVPNGFDDADFEGLAEPPPRGAPLLLYCGRLSGVGGRSPDLLLRTVRAALDSGVSIQFEILGDDSPSLRRAIHRHGLERSVRARPPVEHAEAIRAIREADILAVYQAPGRNRVTPIAGKTYEYLRGGRPILALAPPGDNEELVRSYAPLHAVVTSEDPSRAAEALRELLQRMSTVEGLAPHPEFLRNYSRRNIARQIAGIFDASAGVSRAR